jgi:phage baseplate assembly protein gpV
MPVVPLDREGLFPEEEGEPYGKEGLYRTQFIDGTIFEYDINSREARVYTKGDVFAECDNATVIANKNIDVSADENVNIKASGNISIQSSASLTIQCSTSVTIQAPVINLN